MHQHRPNNALYSTSGSDYQSRLGHPVSFFVFDESRGRHPVNGVAIPDYADESLMHQHHQQR